MGPALNAPQENSFVPSTHQALVSVVEPAKRALKLLTETGTASAGGKVPSFVSSIHPVLASAFGLIAGLVKLLTETGAAAAAAPAGAELPPLFPV